MDELYVWLSAQSGGIRTYIEFQKKSSELAQRDGSNRSVYALLSDLASRFANRYSGEPLPAATAHMALESLKQIVDRARHIDGQSADARLQFLNDIAMRDLADFAMA